MKESRLLGPVCTCLFLISSPTNAVLIQSDLSSLGDGLITYDTVTGLEWLDLTTTQGISYNSVLSSVYVTGHGFHYATTSEVRQLYVNAGFTNTEGSTSANNATVANSLFGLMGITDPLGGTNPTTIDSWGRHDFDVFSSTNSAISHIRWSSRFSGYADADIGLPADKTFPLANTGSYLIRQGEIIQPEPVPIPATTWLFGSGLLGVIGMARRKAG